MTDQQRILEAIAQELRELIRREGLRKRHVYIKYLYSPGDKRKEQSLVYQHKSFSAFAFNFHRNGQLGLYVHVNDLSPGQYVHPWWAEVADLPVSSRVLTQAENSSYEWFCVSLYDLNYPESSEQLLRQAASIIRKGP